MEKQAKIIDTIVIITDFALFFKQFFEKSRGKNYGH